MNTRLDNISRKVLTMWRKKRAPSSAAGPEASTEEAGGDSSGDKDEWECEEADPWSLSRTVSALTTPAGSGSGPACEGHAAAAAVSRVLTPKQLRKSLEIAKKEEKARNKRLRVDQKKAKGAGAAAHHCQAHHRQAHRRQAHRRQAHVHTHGRCGGGHEGAGPRGQGRGRGL